ncbi:hypothetical protein COCCADRAFT_98228 [Bipolaris zeicola 26-R-13]|uniref:Uncharacterized protein n=1 Tax=Cochliobolus carbonum (strain 26-R-13) TaxID=930089 RepID=W6YAW6_COCC2|nr:uncharacterized protein COCCADRAFT_98228 [Bipolaris zeicola 26-R-13]EUC32629.1 hypothetical protein COCCADRAFT_98228 [Bipolaris zeicola 26-R-13]
MAGSETDVWHVTHYAPHILPPTAHGRLALFALGPVMQSAAINSLIATSLFCSHLGHGISILISPRKHQSCCLQTCHAQSKPIITCSQPFDTHIHTKAYVIKRGLHTQNPQDSNPRIPMAHLFPFLLSHFNILP